MGNLNIAFIPARQGSVRLKNKNIINLGGHPLMAYTINVALKSKKFKFVFCITDSKKYQKISEYYGCNNFPLRPKKISVSKDSDYKWVNWAFKELKKKKIKFDNFSILRPTNPFRSTLMINKAFLKFNRSNADSLRAVEKTKIHPGKIWTYKNKYLNPIFNKKLNGMPWHSCQYAALPVYYAQNASLEICKKKSFLKYKNITGKKILPYFTKKYEGYDINTQLDYEFAKKIIKKENFLLKKSIFNV